MKWSDKFVKIESVYINIDNINLIYEADPNSTEIFMIGDDTSVDIGMPIKKVIDIINKHVADKTFNKKLEEL